MGTNYDFIELYNMTGNRFFGGFSCLEAAKPHLDKLREKGELPAINHALLMYEYRHDKNQGMCGPESGPSITGTDGE